MTVRAIHLVDGRRLEYDVTGEDDVKLWDEWITGDHLPLQLRFGTLLSDIHGTRVAWVSVPQSCVLFLEESGGDES